MIFTCLNCLFVFFLTFVCPFGFFFIISNEGAFLLLSTFVCDSLWGCGEFGDFLSIWYVQQRFSCCWHPCFHLVFFLFVLFIEYCLWCCRKTKTLPRWDALRARTKTLKLFNSYCIWLCVCLIYIIYFFVLFVCLQLFCVFIFFFVTWWGFQFILVVSRKSTPNYLFEWEFDFSCFLGRRRKHKLVCVFVLLALTHLVFCVFFSPYQKILVSYLFWIVTV